ncbi:hypothetical protein PFZ55_54285, partial [Streptomyces sp. MS2A]|nr:hypothetical protein [Streptomyces sp. MS2A]
MTASTTAPSAAQDTHAHIDPAAQVAAAGSFVPVQTRSERPHSFDPADFDAPTGRVVVTRLVREQRAQALHRRVLPVDL